MRIRRPRPKRKKTINPTTIKPFRQNPTHNPTSLRKPSGRQGFVLEKGVKVKRVINPELEPRTFKKEVIVARKKNVPIGEVITKQKTFRKSSLNKEIRKTTSRINKLHKKNKKFGLSKKERTLLGVYQQRLRTLSSTRQGTEIKKV